MIYLDYSATTPVNMDVLESYNKTTKMFIGNPNSLHTLGIRSKELLISAQKQISDLFGVNSSEIIFTSGATESNNTALLGVAQAYQKRGNHVILSSLEHPSMYHIGEFLSEFGFKVTYLKHDSEGLVDFDDLKKQITKNTIMVSVCAVNSETGIRQPLKLIKQMIHKVNSNVIFHSDITQALGKVNVNLHDVDIASASSHKIFGPKGIGLLYKSEKIKMIPLINGNEEYRSGTPPLPLIVSFAKALRLSLKELEKKEVFVESLNSKVVNSLRIYPNIKINKTRYSIPHILNVSLMNIKPETFINAMAKKEVYIGTNTACTKGEKSQTLMTLFNDSQRAETSIRISISHVTTTDEIRRFIKFFDEVYQELNNLK